MTTDKKKTIVVIGGGYAGSAVAKELEQKAPNHRILLVEKKTHFYHAVGGVRAAVEDMNIMIPYTNLFKNPQNRVIHAAAVKLEKHTLHLDREVDGSNKIDFDFVVIASGSKYPAPFKEPTDDYETSKAALAKIREQIKQANSILVVGGGPVGIEIAGEIMDAYDGSSKSNKKKSVTIVNSGKKLLHDNLPEKARIKMQRKVENSGVKLIMDDRVDIPKDSTIFVPDGPVTTKNGVSINADLVIVAFGVYPNNQFLDPSLVAKNGFVRVKPTLQVDAHGWEHAYVLGDVADLKEVKMVAKQRGHTPVVVPNLLNALEGKPPTKEWKPSPDFIAVTFGKKRGVLATPWMTLGDWVVSKIKGKDLFLSKQLELFNVKKEDEQPSSLPWPLALSAAAICVAAFYYAYSHKQLTF